MNIETIRIPASELVLGMLVVKLDRPWLETPFRLQGFRISSPAEIRALQKYCKHVFVDIERGVKPPDGKGERVVLDDDFEIIQAEGFIQTSSKPARSSGQRAGGAASAELPASAVAYTIETRFEDELPTSLAAVARAKEALKILMLKLVAGDRGEVDAVRTAATAVEETTLRNPDPALLLRALRSDTSFSFDHSVNSAVLGVALAREMGLRRQNIHELTMGVLLADIGKSQLPKEILRTSRRLYPHETKIVQKHVPFGVQLAQGLGGLTPGTIDIIANHHERFDGSGYPSGLAGGEIPLLARIAGLVDSFDAITSDRGYSGAIPSYEAVQELYASTVPVFQRELLEQLIQVLGTYPVGSLVELSDATVAVVVALNRQRRLLPKVIRLSDAARRPVIPPGILDLSAGDHSGLSVREVLDPGECGIDLPSSEILETATN